MYTLILVFWSALYHLTDFGTVFKYVGIGVFVCMINTLILNLRQRKFVTVFQVKSSWVVMAGVVLVLYHAGFEAAAVFTAAAFMASPLFWATLYEGIVGLTLLAVLAGIIS